MPGETLVYPGRNVKALNVVARAEVSSRYRVINVARQLARPQVDMSEVMQVSAGDFVEANQVIATLKGGLSFLQRSVRVPADGHIATVGPGWVLLETERTATEIQAFINGVVSRVLPNRGVVIESEGTMIEAACGFGGEAYGRLRRLVDSPFEALEANAIDESVSEAIILGGQTVDEETLRTAEEWQVRGIIVGSIQASLLNLNPPVKVRVVATEGFGDIPMSPYTFGVLTSLSRREISIRGQTPGLTPVSNNQWVDETPIILASSIPKGVGTSYTGSSAAAGNQENLEATVGSRVRIIRGNLLGVSGAIDSIPLEPQPTEAGIIAPGAYVKVNNQVQFVPWANLKQIEHS